MRVAREDGDSESSKLPDVRGCPRGFSGMGSMSSSETLRVRVMSLVPRGGNGGGGGKSAACTNRAFSWCSSVCWLMECARFSKSVALRELVARCKVDKLDPTTARPSSPG